MTIQIQAVANGFKATVTEDLLETEYVFTSLNDLIAFIMEMYPDG